MPLGLLLSMQGSNLTGEQILDGFRSIRSWVRGDQRAPHKSLLLLIALAAVQRGVRWMSYTDLEPRLKQLLSDFGPHRTMSHPEYPFWRLRNDGLWEVQHEEALKNRLTVSRDV